VKSVLIVTDAWHPQVNGPVRTMSVIADQLVAKGLRVHFLTPQQFWTVPMPGYREIGLALAPYRQVAKLIDALNPDFIHIAIEGPLGYAARRYCIRHGYPYATSYHTQFPEYIRARAPVPLGVSYAVLRYFHGPAKWCLTPTETVDAELHRRGITNTVVWHRGVDTEMFNPNKRIETGSHKRPVFLYAGRIAVEKNIEAFLKLDLPGTKLVVGGGPQLESLRSRYRDVTFTGRVSDADLAMHFASADVFVFPSRTDTLGLVLYEALASGTPIAAYPVMGPLDVIGDEPVGVLDEDLKTAALRALDIPRENCRAFAERFSWSSSADTFLQYLPQIERHLDKVAV
jgi:glycosyltransferase involved in cell wall biosynthesis